MPDDGFQKLGGEIDKGHIGLLMYLVISQCSTGFGKETIYTHNWNATNPAKLTPQNDNYLSCTASSIHSEDPVGPRLSESNTLVMYVSIRQRDITTEMELESRENHLQEFLFWLLFILFF